MISLILAILSFIMIVSVIPIVVLTFKGRFGFLQGIFSSAGAMLFSFVIMVSNTNRQTGQNVINTAINDSFSQMKQVFETVPMDQLQKMLGNATVEQATSYRMEILNQLTNIMDIYTLLFPSIMMLTMLAISFCGFMLIKQIIGLLKKDVSKFPLFSEFKVSKSASIAIFVSLLGSSISTIDTISAAFFNITVLILGIASLCGFSLLDFKIRQKVDNSWARVLIYIAILVVGFSLSSIILYLYIFAAIFDSFFDFRKLTPKEEHNG